MSVFLHLNSPILSQDKSVHLRYFMLLIDHFSEMHIITSYNFHGKNWQNV